MGMGLVLGAMAEGAGRAGVQALHTAQQQYGAEELLKMKQEADRELQASMQAHQSGENALGRDLTREEGAAGRSHATELQKSNQGFTQAENTLNRQLQVDLETMREAAAKNRHDESIKVQMASLGIQQQQLKLAQEQITLVPQNDGSMLKMSKDGKPQGTLTDLSGNVIYGTKDVSASTKLVMEMNTKIIGALESEIKAETDPAAKKDLRERMESLKLANERLAGLAPKEGAASASTPTEAHVAALLSKKNDPRAVAAFNRAYGEGAAERVLKAPNKTPDAPVREGIVNKEAGRHDGIYGPLTSRAVIERDAAAGVAEAIAYKKELDERDANTEGWRSTTGGMVR